MLDLCTVLFFMNILHLESYFFSLIFIQLNSDYVKSVRKQILAKLVEFSLVNASNRNSSIILQTRVANRCWIVRWATVSRRCLEIPFIRGSITRLVAATVLISSWRYHLLISKVVSFKEVVEYFTVIFYIIAPQIILFLMEDFVNLFETVVIIR